MRRCSGSSCASAVGGIRNTRASRSGASTVAPIAPGVRSGVSASADLNSPGEFSSRAGGSSPMNERRPAMLSQTASGPSPHGSTAPRPITATGSRVTGGVHPALLWNDGSKLSSTAWKFVPPKPNDETPARRGSPCVSGQGCTVVATWNGVSSHGIAGFPSSWFRAGGTTRWCRPRIVAIRPAAPAAPMRWPT